MLLLVLSGMTGCYKSEFDVATKQNDQLMEQNSKLKEQVQQLEATVKKLQETAQSYFVKGNEKMASGEWEAAIREYKLVITNYPNDPLINDAKSSLEFAERKIAEAEEKEFIEVSQAKEQEKNKYEISGEPIRYVDFYVKSQTGNLKNGKRYQFQACVYHSHGGQLVDSPTDYSHSIRDVNMNFDSQSEYERLLAAKSPFCGTIVSAKISNYFEVYSAY